MVYDFHHKGTKPQRTQKDDLPIRKPRFYYKYTIINSRVRIDVKFTLISALERNSIFASE
jgi:hypothetical protein